VAPLAVPVGHECHVVRKRISDGNRERRCRRQCYGTTSRSPEPTSTRAHSRTTRGRARGSSRSPAGAYAYFPGLPSCRSSAHPPREEVPPPMLRSGHPYRRVRGRVQERQEGGPGEVHVRQRGTHREEVPPPMLRTTSRSREPPLTLPIVVLPRTLVHRLVNERSNGPVGMAGKIIPTFTIRVMFTFVHTFPPLHGIAAFRLTCVFFF
jgi:hypothetical protein